ncbi:MAG: acyltransferase [Bacteroidetes bacterium]|nr:acyltransferase [Bacteroidota bacterium]
MKNKHNLFSKISEVPLPLQTSYFYTLDGLRAFSIIIVVVAHINNHLFKNRYLDIIFREGLLGVTIFFVISGFLITSLLFKEQIETGTISLKKFYLRRLFRIFPLVLLYVLFLICLNSLFHLEIHFMTFIGCLFFLANFNLFNRSQFSGHFWSLAFEEQYYVIFPFLLKKMYSFFICVVLLFVIILPVLLFWAGYFHFYPSKIWIHFAHFIVQFIPLLIGSLLAVFMFKNYSIPIIGAQKNINYLNTLLIVLIIGLNIDRIENVFESYVLFIKNIIVVFLIACFIGINVNSHSRSLLFNILNSKIFIKIGILSYSIYIWQQAFTLFDNKLPVIFTAFPYNIIILLLVSFLSYNYYEKIFLRLKKRFK